MSSQSQPQPSPGNGYTPHIPVMRVPSLRHLYRVTVQMDREGYETKAIQGPLVDRFFLAIAGGKLEGPQIKGTIVPHSGGDWSHKIRSEKPWYRLDARYIIHTEDGYNIYVQAKGVYHYGPGVEDRGIDISTVAQDEVEYFSHLTYEAPGDSPYAFMNRVVAVGVMSMFEGNVVIDSYRLTNFAGLEPEGP